MFDCDKTHYYRFNDYQGASPEQQAIEQLQEDVERIDGDIDTINTELGKKIEDWHKHAGVAQFYVSLSGSDDNDGLTKQTPFRTLHKIFDPNNCIFDKGYTNVRIDFLTTGTFTVYEDEMPWQYYNDVSLRLQGPERATQAELLADMPIVHFNAPCVNFNNSFLYFDSVSVKVGDGFTTDDADTTYNRFHLENTSVIANLTTFEESKTAPHGCHCSYTDCIFTRFGCVESFVSFNKTSKASHAFTQGKVIANPHTGGDNPLFVEGSLVVFNDRMRFRTPDVDNTTNLIRNVGSYVVLNHIDYYGSGSGKYGTGLNTKFGTTIMSSNIYTTELEPKVTTGRNMNGLPGILAFDRVVLNGI